MSTKDAILQNILLHEVLLRRKPMLDQLCGGLAEVGFGEMWSAFRDMFKVLLVPGPNANTTPRDIIDLLEYSGDAEGRSTFEMLISYVKELDEEGTLM
jgi:hypothetical protein